MVLAPSVIHSHDVYLRETPSSTPFNIYPHPEVGLSCRGNVPALYHSPHGMFIHDPNILWLPLVLGQRYPPSFSTVRRILCRILQVDFREFTF
jgi:hypothetical protein